MKTIGIEGTYMTNLLEKAFEEASKLPAAEQDEFAKWILDELASELRWKQAFESSPDKLAKLADEALVEYREGRTVEMRVDDI
jgi:hypothetical protein